MIASFINFLSLQATPSFPREGLPYWIFWFLLCIILLLITFIFLRDKDLRQRLSSFLSGAKRKWRKIRLQAKLKKERQKKIDLLKELGKKSWGEDIKVEKSEEICTELKALDEKKNHCQMEWKEIFSKIQILNKKYEESRHLYRAQIKEQEDGKKSFEEKMIEIKEKQGLEKEREEIQKKIDESGEKIKRIEEEDKTRSHEFEKEIREWQKEKEKVQEKINEIEKLTEPLFECLGKVIDEHRIDHKEFVVIYSQIDRANKTIQDLIHQIETLHS